jgi:hypothetical protein
MGLDLKDVVGLTTNVIIAGAGVVGGAWAFLRYRRERMDRPALDLEMVTDCSQQGRAYVVFLDVCITNKGKIKWQPFTRRDPNQPVLKDGCEEVNYSVSLQLKRLVLPTETEDRYIDWYGSSALQPVPDLGEINLLTQYEYEDDPKADFFWMEPGESYHFGVPLVLDSGLYLAKLTCVGVGGADDYWTRTLLLKVPEIMKH